MDLTVLSIPIYFGTMEAERRFIAARAAERGPSAADYTRPDATTSLLMGVGSIVAPIVVPRLVRNFVPGKGKHGKAVVATAVGAAGVTTIADRLARLDGDSGDIGRVADAPDVSETREVGSRDVERVADASDVPRNRWRGRIARAARTMRTVTGPVAVGAATFAGATAFKAATSPKAQWAKNGRDLGGGVVASAVAVAGWDFIYYWNHRLSHEVRLLWAQHVTHHSSEHYNLSTALRQPVSDLFLFQVPYGILARFGVRPALVEQARGINLLYQYWIHTETIDRIGPGEEVLNTPSHHRVHHGSNARYLDRNHGSILIVWDRLFGTFQREDEPVAYGLTKNIGTYNPVTVIAHEYRDILRDVARCTNWRDRLSFVLRGPGWGKDRHRELGGLSPRGPSSPAPAASG